MSFKSKISGFIRFVFLLALLALPFAIFFAVREPAGLPPIPADSDQQAENFERKIIFLEQSWSQKQPAEVGFSAAEVNSAYLHNHGEDLRVAFVGNQAMLFFDRKIMTMDIYAETTGKFGVNQRRITFTSTNLNIGQLPIPATLANPIIQDKMRNPALQEQLRLPQFISTVRIKEGQLMLGTSPKGR